MNVIILHEVWPELLASGEWYQLQNEGLGSEFMDAVDAAVKAIGESPLRYPVIYRNVRRAQIERFPFGAFFVVNNDEVCILSIVHFRRNPRSWQRWIPTKRRRH